MRPTVLFEHLRRYRPKGFGATNTAAAAANNSRTALANPSQIRAGLDHFRRRGKPVAPLWQVHGNRETLVRTGQVRDEVLYGRARWRTRGWRAQGDFVRRHRDRRLHGRWRTR